MKWFVRQIRVVVRKQPPLKEEMIDLAMALKEESLVWRALHQLIDTAEENANENAAMFLVEQREYVGGAKHLRMLREELVRRRDRGIAIMGAAKPEGAE